MPAKFTMGRVKVKISAVLLLVNVVVAQWVVDPETLPAMPNATHTCVMWGECYVTSGGSKSCEYRGPPRQILHAGLSEEIRAQVLDILETRCPSFLYDENNQRKPDDEVYTCCTTEQLIDASSSMPMADGVLGRCPACLRNYVRQICEMNCSPEQSRFLEVYTETSPDGIVYVDEIDFRMHESFMVESHAACAGVIVPQTGLPAINLMCGSAAVCDPDSWYGFSGDVVSNPFVGTQVNFLRWPTMDDSMSVAALYCNETFGDDLPCSCVDCVESCPLGNEPVVTDVCTVLSVNCISFSIGITFFVISVTIFSILTLVEYRKLRNSNQTKPNESIELNQLIIFFRKIFFKIGTFSASNSMLIILLTSWIVFAMIFGFNRLIISSNPIEIWSAPESRSRQEFNYFNTRFGPFYRAAQVFLNVEGLDSFTENNVTYGPAYRIEAIQELIKVEDAIINIARDTGGVTLEQICYAPMRTRGSEEKLDQCTLMSASVYLNEDRNNINNATYLRRILNCLNNYFGLDCMASWGGGAEPEIAFGGYEGDNILEANTLVINFPLSNHLNNEDLAPVLEWEKNFLNLMRDYDENWKSDFVDVSYAAERSIEDEIERVSRAEAVPIIASYFLMFIYITLALGKFKSCQTFLVGSKILVAVGSIVVVLIAIFCALGTMGYFGISTTLLAINVIPFFVLSVGIDNVFLMVNTLREIENNLKQYDDYSENLSLNKKRRFIFGKMLEKIGPSIFVTSTTQITCFAIGTTANFPAVTTFAVFASFALGYLFIFQITAVVSILSIDYKRTVNKRLDVFFCIQTKILDDSNPLTSNEPYVSITQKLMGPYSKFILNWRVKIIVAILFMALVSVSVMLIPSLEIGLDQELSLPKDSYVYKYLQSVNNVFKLGVPVYFVLKSGLNFSDPVHQNVVCGGLMCNTDSLTTQIFLASRHSEITYIAKSSNSWLDDFFDWSGLHGSCCKYNIEDGSFCQSTNSSSVCNYCYVDMDRTGVRPTGESFERYMPFFLQDEPTDTCNKGGLASYFGSVNYILDEEGRAYVQDTNFMAYHNQLSTSYDYITALKFAYEISDNITTSIKEHTGLDVEVFAYSVFYPFYEQYLSMWSDTFASIGYSLIGVAIIIFLTSGFNFLTTFAILFTTILVVVNMMGLMYIWNIPLNAVSCVNLIVSIGISVEFCSHLAYAFATSRRPQEERVADAIKTVGSTIITGITFTNIPIVVLAFSYTEIIEIFFFRMFFGLVILGFIHGMIFLPVLLSFLSNFTQKPNSSYQNQR